MKRHKHKAKRKLSEVAKNNKNRPQARAVRYMKLYHGTNAEALKSILRQGLIPNGGITDFTDTLYEGATEEGHSYLCRNKRLALQYGDSNDIVIYEEGGRMVLQFEIPKPFVDEHFEPDPNLTEPLEGASEFHKRLYGGSVMTRQTLKPEWISGFLYRRGGSLVVLNRCDLPDDPCACFDALVALLARPQSK